MVDDVMHVTRVKVLQDRHYDSTISDCCQKRDTPTGVILPDDGDFITSTQLAMLEKKMNTCYLSCHLSISEGVVFSIVRQAFQIPVFTKTFLV